jgi:uncharacterized protein
MPVPTPSAREPWVDALRALALLGVFIVNAVGYGLAPGYPAPLGAPQPVDSALAQAVHSLLVALVQGKAWSLLCFLFGYSLCAIALSARARGLPVGKVLRSRYLRLGLVGVLHGAFVYYGDVLTIYAVCGLLATSVALVRPKTLLRIWWGLTFAMVLMGALTWFIGLAFWFDWGVQGAGWAQLKVEGGLVNADGIRAFWRLNAGTYFDAQINLAIAYLPMLLWLTVAGMLARRFRLLSARRFARQFWSRHVGAWQLAGALALNAVLGLGSVLVHQSGVLEIQRIAALSAWGPMAAIWLVAAWLAWAMRRWQQRAPLWVAWLAPAGRHTLVMYLSLSILLMLSSGAFLGWSGGTVLTLALALCAWWAAAIVARSASSHGWRDPIAQWLSRTAARAKTR